MHSYPVMALALAGSLLLATSAGWAGEPTSAEVSRARDWALARFGDGETAPSAEPPFSFAYGDRPSSGLLSTWKIARTSRRIDNVRTERAVTYTDPESGLAVTCRAIEYTDFPTVEWTLQLRNTGTTDTPILSDIQALDATFRRSDNGEFALHYNTGDNCSPESYAPHVEAMGPNAVKQFSPVGGRPTNGGYPYFNVEMPGGGVIAVVGWPGQWSARFKRDGGNGLRIRSGQELTRFTLHPGEEVRSPLIVLQFYDGDWIRGQNTWRRWMLAHNTPRLDGKPMRPIASACNGNHYPGIITNAAEEMHFMRRYLEEGIKPDFWWEDAGWYKCGDPPSWVNTGTWEVDPSRWPKGIREVSDWCRTNGIRTIVWFEPERVAAGTWLAEDRPEWILGGANGGLLNIGIPECREWLTDRIDTLLTEQGIDLYRQDFNIDPLPYWRSADAQDRQGITEIRHVEGYLAYWDELKRRHNGMLIDSCASGGRRNDVETLRRAVPLLRSDNIFDPLAEQCHTYGISFWVPFNGTGFMTFDKYLIRSAMCPEFTMGVDTRNTDENFGMLRKAYADWQRVSPCFLGDYYPLTPHSLEKNVWIAWQFDLPEKGEGIVQAFRRDECGDESRTLKLCGLDRDAVYTVENLDTGASLEIPGRELIDEGLRVEIAGRPGSALIAYRRSRPDPPDRPTLTFEDPDVQAVNGEAYAHALDNLLRINVLKAGPKQMKSGLVTDPPGTFLRAGGNYQDPWTRDASVNSWNALSLLAPDLARNTLWAVCERLPDGAIRIQNDNQWWDKVIWVIAAWNHYATTGDRAFLAQAYDASLNTVGDLLSARFDKEYGLFQGPSHLQDGIAGYPPPFNDPPGSSSFVLNHPGADKLMTLSTNCLYYHAFKDLAKMAAALGKGAGVANGWNDRAAALRKAINDRLWMPDFGSYAYMLYGEGDLRGKQAKYQEATGLSLAVLFGIPDGDRARQVVRNVRTTKYGIPLVDPEFPRYSGEKPGRHSRIVWPLAQGYWATAAAKVGEIVRFGNEVDTVAHLAKSTDWNFYEIYSPTTGKPDGGWQCGSHWGSCSNQAWSASAYVRMIHCGLFGMEFTPDGIALAPTLPAEWGGVTLSGLRYRDAILDIRLSGSGGRVSRFTLDGGPASKPFIPSSLTGKHRIEIALQPGP